MSCPPRFLTAFAAPAAVLVLLCAGCSNLSTTAPAPTSASKPENKDAVLVKAPLDLSFLLSMSFVEAKSISTQQLEFPPYLKIAADSIEVFKYTADGKPRKARARGKVFIEMNFSESAKALCQEAFITEDEIILRGTPILQRGGSMVEGLDESTIFYMFGTSLRVIGLHKVTNQTEMASLLPALGTWAQGPNPLLPPLTESAVPSSIRDAMQRAAEAEMLHQKTREIYGPATPPSADSPSATPPAAPEKASGKPKDTPPQTATPKKPSMVEIRRAVPSKPSFWGRFRKDKTQA
ncbi:MAG: hypothetical protein JNM65_20535 [Verrucomicrobiaceae bacterium]|nr:hypothetical protein [Verrucomicrobiaceae bacterium]